MRVDLGTHITQVWGGSQAHSHMALMDGMPMDGMTASRAPDTAVSRFKCSPLTDAERVFAYDLGGFHHE